MHEWHRNHPDYNRKWLEAHGRKVGDDRRTGRPSLFRSVAERQEHKKEYMRRWRESHPNSAREWRSRNPNYGRQRKRTSPDKARVYNQKYRDGNAAELNARSNARRRERRVTDAEYAQRERDRCLRQWKNRRFSLCDRIKLLRAQDGKCANPACQKELGEAFHIDHIIPLARGGTSDPENLQLLCPRCNCSKGAKDPQEWLTQVSSERTA
jgi:5-methylcytosine-specific restriction endonuclease McrA